MSSNHPHLLNREFTYTTKLTEKQNVFVNCILSGKNQIESYKHAYGTKSSNKVIGISANALLKNPKIIKAIQTRQIEQQKDLNNALKHQEIQMYLADELTHLYSKIKDESTQVRILEMLFSISKNKVF